MNANARNLKSLVKETKLGVRQVNLMVTEVRGVKWYTETHFAGVADPALADLLAEYNLSVEPNGYAVNGSVQLVPEVTLPRMETIVPDTLAGYHEARQATYRGSKVYGIYNDHSVRCVEWEGGAAAYRDGYMSHLESQGVTAWHARTSRAPLVGTDHAGAIVAVVMAIRDLFAGTA